MWRRSCSRNLYPAKVSGNCMDEERNSRTAGNMKYKYHIDLFYRKEDGGYVANIPDLQMCSAFGGMQEEALREV